MHFGLVPQLDTLFVLNSTVRRRPMLSLLDSPLLLTCVNLVHFDQAFITGENVFFATSKSHSIFAAGLCTARCMSLSARSKDERRKWTMRYYKGLLQLIYQHIKSDGFFGPRRPIAIWNFTHNMSLFPRASALTRRADHIYWKYRSIQLMPRCPIVILVPRTRSTKKFKFAIQSVNNQAARSFS